MPAKSEPADEKVEIERGDAWRFRIDRSGVKG